MVSTYPIPVGRGREYWNGTDSTPFMSHMVDSSRHRSFGLLPTEQETFEWSNGSLSPSSDVDSADNDSWNRKRDRMIVALIEDVMSDAQIARNRHLRRLIHQDPEGFVDLNVILATIPSLSELVEPEVNSGKSTNKMIANAVAQYSKQLITRDDESALKRRDPQLKRDLAIVAILEDDILSDANLASNHHWRRLLKKNSEGYVDLDVFLVASAHLAALVGASSGDAEAVARAVSTFSLKLTLNQNRTALKRREPFDEHNNTTTNGINGNGTNSNGYTSNSVFSTSSFSSAPGNKTSFQPYNSLNGSLFNSVISPVAPISRVTSNSSQPSITNEGFSAPVTRSTSPDSLASLPSAYHWLLLGGKSGSGPENTVYEGNVVAVMGLNSEKPFGWIECDALAGKVSSKEVGPSVSANTRQRRDIYDCGKDGIVWFSFKDGRGATSISDRAFHQDVVFAVGDRVVFSLNTYRADMQHPSDLEKPYVTSLMAWRLMRPLVSTTFSPAPPLSSTTSSSSVLPPNHFDETTPYIWLLKGASGDRRPESNTVYEGVVIESFPEAFKPFGIIKSQTLAEEEIRRGTSSRHPTDRHKEGIVHFSFANVKDREFITLAIGDLIVFTLSKYRIPVEDAAKMKSFRTSLIAWRAMRPVAGAVVGVINPAVMQNNVRLIGNDVIAPPNPPVSPEWVLEGKEGDTVVSEGTVVELTRHPASAHVKPFGFIRLRENQAAQQRSAGGGGEDVGHVHFQLMAVKESDRDLISVGDRVYFSLWAHAISSQQKSEQTRPTAWRVMRTGERAAVEATEMSSNFLPVPGVVGVPMSSGPASDKVYHGIVEMQQEYWGILYCDHLGETTFFSEMNRNMSRDARKDRAWPPVIGDVLEFILANKRQRNGKLKAYQWWFASVIVEADTRAIAKSRGGRSDSGRASAAITRNKTKSPSDEPANNVVSYPCSHCSQVFFLLQALQQHTANNHPLNEQYY